MVDLAVDRHTGPAGQGVRAARQGAAPADQLAGRLDRMVGRMRGATARDLDLDLDLDLNGRVVALPRARTVADRVDHRPRSGLERRDRGHRGGRERQSRAHGMGGHRAGTAGCRGRTVVAQGPVVARPTVEIQVVDR